jgi:hypothetical protein
LEALTRRWEEHQELLAGIEFIDVFDATLGTGGFAATSHYHATSVDMLDHFRGAGRLRGSQQW